MKPYLPLLISACLLLSGCYKSGYNPGYIISDKVEQDPATEDEKPHKEP